MHAPAPSSTEDNKYTKFAMNLSLSVGILLFFIKGFALWLTDSTAVLSDAAESIVHLAAISFAFYSMKFASRPADKGHNYGHGKIAFFSAGFEGAVVLFTSLLVAWLAFRTLYRGDEIHFSLLGIILVASAGLINGVLGSWLIHLGKKNSSLILRANGLHLLTDTWTSAAALIGLILVQITGQQWWDPILALVITVNLLIAGYKLIKESIAGLMDEVDPHILHHAEEILEKESKYFNLEWHDLRIRPTGEGFFVEAHLLFPEGISLVKAHHHATIIEIAVCKDLKGKIEIITHLEPSEDHDGTGENIAFTKTNKG